MSAGVAVPAAMALITVCTCCVRNALRVASRDEFVILTRTSRRSLSDSGLLLSSRPVVPVLEGAGGRVVEEPATVEFGGRVVVVSSRRSS